MEDEKLIECVRKFEFLYNLQHPKYMDSAKKEMAWKEISQHLRQPASACKQRWQGLRDSYRRSLKKKKSRIRKGVKNLKKWKYEEEMAFVASFFVERKTLESNEITSDDEESQNNDAPTEVPMFYDNDINNTDAGTMDVAASEIATDTEIHNEEDNQSLQPQHSQAKKAKTVRAKKAEVQPVQSASALLMSRLLDTQSIIPQQREQDELDRFFLNISETVKKFSPYQQAMAKNKIFSLVSEMELQELTPINFKSEYC